MVLSLRSVRDENVVGVDDEFLEILWKIFPRWSKGLHYY